MADHQLFQTALFVLLGAATVGVFVTTRDTLRAGFLLFIWLLGLGFRTHAATPTIKIIPAELVLLALVFFTGRRRDRSAPRPGGLPWWLVVMIPFWAVAWFPSDWNQNPWDVKFAEFRNFVLAVPLFLVAPAALAREGAWRSVVLAVLGVGSWIAAMGVVEYLAPGIAQALPGFSGNPDPVLVEGFARARFSFYGSPIAVFVCVLAVPLTAAAWGWVRSDAGRAALAAGAGLQLAAVYVSGYRSIWLVVAVQFAAFVVMRRQVLLGAVAVAAALAGYQAIPDATRVRVQSLVNVLGGRPDEVDTSGQKRWARAAEAFDAALDRPLGHGWAASGWVHSDFIQVAANQGWAAGLALLAGYLVTLARLGVRATGRGLPDHLAPLGVPLFLSFLAVGAILLFEGVQTLPQTVLPVWLAWAMAETWLRQTARPNPAPPAEDPKPERRRVLFPAAPPRPFQPARARR